MIERAEYRRFAFRSQLLYLMVFFSLYILGHSLYNLQVEDFSYYQLMSEKNRIRTVLIPAPRGKIFDRNHRLLADNRPQFDLVATIEDIKESSTPEIVADDLSPLIRIPSEVILKSIFNRIKSLPYEPNVIASDISLDEVVRISENLYRLPGIDIVTKPTRIYPFKDTASHVLGYTGIISAEKYQELKQEGYDKNDIVGKNGIEVEFEEILKGINGARQIQVNHLGHLDQVLGQKDPDSGRDIQVSIDIELQQKIIQAYNGRRGAACVLDVRTGDVLAMVSLPGFDSNAFSAGDATKIKEYFSDENAPLLNRTIATELAPGSIFKPLVALAGLNTHFLNMETSVKCNGSFSISNYTYRCWKKWGHGEVNLHNSIRESCNVFYYILSKEMGSQEIIRLAREFGLGSKSGIPLPGERSGLVPDSAWKKSRFSKRENQSWHLGDTINLSIGQGYLLTTPIQMAVFTGIIASKGLKVTPRLLMGTYSDTQEFTPSPPKTEKISGGNETHFNYIRDAMYSVVQNKRGTGRNASLPGLEAAGKTGTAQYRSGAVLKKNAWFIAFAPFESPEIALSILVEDANSGGHDAAPIARHIFSHYFHIPLPESPVVETPVTTQDEEVLDEHTIIYEDPQPDPELLEIENPVL